MYKTLKQTRSTGGNGGAVLFTHDYDDDEIEIINRIIEEDGGEHKIFVVSKKPEEVLRKEGLRTDDVEVVNVLGFDYEFSIDNYHRLRTIAKENQFNCVIIFEQPLFGMEADAVWYTLGRLDPWYADYHWIIDAVADKASPKPEDLF